MKVPRKLPLPFHVEIHGRSGDPILLLHGFGTNGFTWNRWVPDLSRDHLVVVVDMKGFGNAPKPADGQYSPLDQAELVWRLIVQENLSDLTLVGHSMGGGVALLSALRLLKAQPHRLRRIVVVAGAAFPQSPSPWIRRAARPWMGPFLLRLLPPRLIVRKALEVAYARPERITRSQVEAYADPLRNREGRRALIQTARQLLPPGVEEYVSRLGGIQVPALLLWGDQDRIVPLSTGKRLALTLPRATLEVLEDCGHMPQEEQPLQALERVRRFLEATAAHP